MKKTLKLALIAVLPTLWAGGCKNFLSGEKLTTDPNNPTAATPDQLFTGVQVGTFSMYEGTAALQSLVWTQQLSGVARQWSNYARYSFTEGLNDYDFSNVYRGGGLKDVRLIQDQAKAAGNDKLLGMAQVYEAIIVGTAADWWGNIPYSEAITAEAPKFDNQLAVYAALQTVLDQAITNLSSGKGAGTLALDLVYNNDASRYIDLAHTLKARLYLHSSRFSDSLTVFGKALAQAQLGIKDVTRDFVSVHSTSVGERNLFFEFSLTRAGDIEPNAVVVNLLNAGNETALLNDYYLPSTGGTFVGSPADASAPNVSSFNLKADRKTRFVTHAENQMILAEMQYRTGAQATALVTLNAFRAERGAPAVAAAGINILVAILREKFVNLFMNPEVWADYRRTCYPNITPPARAARPYVPGRFFYGYTERISNPNTPDVSAQEAQPAVPAFPKLLKDVTGTVDCFGQKSRPGT